MEPGRNDTRRPAAMLIVFPVRGLRPWRAFVSVTRQLPKPVRLTPSCFASASLMVSTTALTALAACDLGMPVRWATRAVSSLLPTMLTSSR